MNNKPSADPNQLVTVPWWLLIAFMAEGVAVYVWLCTILPWWFITTTSILGAGAGIALAIKYRPMMKAELASKPRWIRVRTHPAWIVTYMRCMLILMTLMIVAGLLFAFL